MTATDAELHLQQWPTTGAARNVTDKHCPAGCGARFFTNVGLSEHVRVGCGNGHGSPVTVRRSWRLTPAGRRALHERGLAVTALNNARRVRCDQCGRETTPPALANHQRATGHTGKTEVT